MRRSPRPRRRRTRPTLEHVAFRTCIGCRRRAAASQLWRTVVSPHGDVVVDRHGSGRGAWLCADSAACFTHAVRRRAFGRAFRRSIEPAAVSLLARAFEASSAHVRESGVIGLSADAPLPRGKADR